MSTPEQGKHLERQGLPMAVLINTKKLHLPRQWQAKEKLKTRDDYAKAMEAVNARSRHEKLI